MPWRLPPAAVASKAEKDPDGAIRAVAAACRALIAHDVMLAIYEDRRPAVLIPRQPRGARVTAGAVVNRAKATAREATAAYLRQHYQCKARFSRIPTADPEVTHHWMHTLGVAFLTDEEYRLMFRARFGLLPLNAHRQRANRAARCCAYCRANGTAPIETLTHVFSVCPRYRNIMRMRHDDIAALVLAAVITAREAAEGVKGRYEVRREVTLGQATAGGVADEHLDLRPDAFIHDRHTGSTTPVEFTVPDDAGITTAVRNKHDKYGGILRAATPALPTRKFDPLVVFAIGAWGTVHPSTTNALIRLGIQPHAVTATLRKVVKIAIRYAAMIARRRFAAEGRSF